MFLMQALCYIHIKDVKMGKGVSFTPLCNAVAVAAILRVSYCTSLYCNFSTSAQIPIAMPLPSNYTKAITDKLVA